MEEQLLRSQHGEDRLLAEHFRKKRRGHFVEVGALDGEHLSNTYYFEKALGWRGVLVEAHPDKARACREKRPGSQVWARAVVAPGRGDSVTLQVVEGNEAYSTLSTNRTYERLLAERNLVTTPVEVPTATLDEVLTEAALPSIDFVSIDVEGHELDVLRGFDVRRWAPEVILLEGASSAPDPRIVLRLFRAGYCRVRRVVVNDWYERRPLGARIGHLVMSYLTSAPTVARTLVREALRTVGLLDAVRRRRAARR